MTERRVPNGRDEDIAACVCWSKLERDPACPAGPGQCHALNDDGTPINRPSAASARECPDCGGHGWYVTTGTEWVFGCCGRYTERGECCENPDLFPEPVPEQTPCERCHMTGRIEEALRA